MTKFLIEVDDSRFDGEVISRRDQECLVRQLIEDNVYFDPTFVRSIKVRSQPQELAPETSEPIQPPDREKTSLAA